MIGLTDKKMLIHSRCFIEVMWNLITELGIAKFTTGCCDYRNCDGCPMRNPDSRGCPCMLRAKEGER